ncbi:manganese iron superoxide dismutase, binding site [Purpureocillium lavendulum]|uniref:Manganese iron superoxide dismutase, binding site n=1 Tax=Purpureocillium lavendulum TaxID=1247861 RepID=A0AB34FQX5_9HYPO|nr:manganese iron superoxide dismutase, binding site [Purpureocillium lavendulum]
MALRHKRGISPLRRDHYHHDAPATAAAPTMTQPHAPPIGYVLEWTSGATQTRQRRRHALCGVEDLRTELLAGRDDAVAAAAPGSGRMLVIRAPLAAAAGDAAAGGGGGGRGGDGRGGLRDEVVGALGSIAGVDGGFLAAHEEGGVWRPRVRSRRARWWCWAYPEITTTPTTTAAEGGGRAAGGEGLAVCRASLWLASQIPILFINDRAATSTPLSPLPPSSGSTAAVAAAAVAARPTPKLRHQDAATTASRLGKQPSGGRYGATGTSPPSAASSAAISMAMASRADEDGGDSSSSRRRREVSTKTAERAWALEEELWDALVLMGGGGGTSGHPLDVSIEELVGELVYERWAAWLAGRQRRRQQHHCTASSSSPPSLPSLWAAMAALEQNLDEARHLARQGRVLEAVSPSAWGDLLQRVQARVHLAQMPGAYPPPSPPPASSSPSPSSSSSPSSMVPAGAAAAAGEAGARGETSLGSGSRAARGAIEGTTRGAGDDLIDERSLDRIAYLGGLLLPVTVVAGVLSIEGDYGPEGSNFWVFWVASLVASAAALLVIYADQLRSLEVWLEVPDDVDADDQLQQHHHHHHHQRQDEAAVEAQVLGAAANGTTVRPAARYLVQRWQDGSARRTWRRDRLGWGGAVKKMSGYYRWKGDAGVRFGHPGDAVRVWTDGVR